MKKGENELKVNLSINKEELTSTLKNKEEKLLNRIKREEKEGKEEVYSISPSDIIFRPFGEITYFTQKKAGVGKTKFLSKELNDVLDSFIKKWTKHPTNNPTIWEAKGYHIPSLFIVSVIAIMTQKESNQHAILKKIKSIIIDYSQLKSVFRFNREESGKWIVD